MPQRRNNSGFQRQGSRPNRSWSHVGAAAQIAIPAASKVLLGSFTPTNPGIDETVLRVLGSIAVRSDQIAATESQLGSFGMIVTTDTAVAAGIASIPGPFTDGGDDWFVYQDINQSFVFASAIGFDPLFSQRYPIDSKAKRMVTEGRVLALVVENGHATEGFDFTFNIRVLSQVRGTR